MWLKSRYIASGITFSKNHSNTSQAKIYLYVYFMGMTDRFNLLNLFKSFKRRYLVIFPNFSFTEPVCVTKGEKREVGRRQTMEAFRSRFVPLWEATDPSCKTPFQKRVTHCLLPDKKRREEKAHYRGHHFLTFSFFFRATTSLALPKICRQ